MKADEVLKEELVKNLKEWFEKVNEKMNYYIDRIEISETVEEIMHCKKYILIDYLQNTPLGASVCYFCIAKELGKIKSCKDCFYGKLHGFCYEPFSDYQLIREKLASLIDIINEKYYKGEIYEK